MRAFIIFCLVATACGDKLGYNYRPASHSDFGLSFTPGGDGGSHSVAGSYHVGGGASSGGAVGGYGIGGSQGGVIGSHGTGTGSVFRGFHDVSGSYGVGGGQGVGGGSGYGGFGGHGASSGRGFGGSNGDNFGVGGSSHGSFDHAPQVELEKEFYTFTVNEDDFSVPHVENQISSSAKKGLRVIFIKGPESNGLENAAVALAKHIAEQKTAIYVLQKQADLGSLTNKLNAITSNVNHKPEVHFVKYRTPEDAVNAQKAIRSQYDSLGGVSNNFNGGEASVLNFASKVPAPASHSSSGLSTSVGSSRSLDNSGSSGSSGSFGYSGSAESSAPVGSSGSSGISGLSSPSSIYLPA